MPPLTNSQSDTIANASKNAKVTTQQLENPVVTPNLPATTPPKEPTIASIDSFISNPTVVSQDTTALENQTSDIFNELFGAKQATQSRGRNLTKLEETAGIPTLTTELAQIQNDINQKSLDFRREREAIQRGTGLTASQVNARLADVSRKQSSELADLEVIRAARSNSLNAIQSIIDRKVERQFADEDARIKNLQFIYDNVKGDLTKAQDRKYNEMITRENRAFEIAKTKFEQVENAKARAIESIAGSGAPTSVYNAIMKGEDIGTITKLASPYSEAYLKRQLLNEQINKAREEVKATTLKPLSGEASKLIAISSGLESDVNSIKAKIEKVGYEKFLRGYLLGTDRETVKLLSNAADKVGRIRSGGAINKDEETRFLSQFASKGDYAFGTKDIATNALDSILNEATTVRSGIDPNNAYSTQATITTTAPNKFQQATGVTAEFIPGAEIVQTIKSDGTLIFKLP